ncbi:MAG: N-acetylneuraminate synthase family protein, partial [Candidatus Lindowbacteria bacterium]|nr:N-acetylneuraminate synthase family protein [Candidatus Lindowbacteria bacterium]
AATLGGAVVERHITLDRSMWGSDQAASVEPHGFRRIVRDIRAVEDAMGIPEKRIFDAEIPIQKKLRRKTDF